MELCLPAELAHVQQLEQLAPHERHLVGAALVQAHQQRDDAHKGQGGAAQLSLGGGGGEAGKRGEEKQKVNR